MLTILHRAGARMNQCASLLAITICLLAFVNAYSQPGGGDPPGDPGGDPDVEGAVPDSIEFHALKDLYDSLGGVDWINKSGWPTTWPQSATAAEMASWFGITVVNGDISQIMLGGNNLRGRIPTSIGGLTQVIRLWMYSNQLEGPIPSTIGNITQLLTLQLHQNHLSGTIPSSLGTRPFGK